MVSHLEWLRKRSFDSSDSFTGERSADRDSAVPPKVPSTWTQAVYDCFGGEAEQRRGQGGHLAGLLQLRRSPAGDDAS